MNARRAASAIRLSTLAGVGLATPDEQRASVRLGHRSTMQKMHVVEGRLTR
jgi:hypothetical protein